MADETGSVREAEFGPYSVEHAAAAPVIPWDQRTAYEQWCERQGIPVVRGFYIEDLARIETAPWEERGADGAIIALEGTDETNGSYVLRIAGGSSSNWSRNMYEEVFYVVEGEGLMEVESGRNVITCRWSTGSLFTPPINTRYRHIATTSAMLYCVHSAPPVMNLFHSDDFVVKNTYEFKDRFDGAEDYFSTEGRLWQRPDGAGVWETTLVDDVNTFELPPLKRRGGSGQMVTFQLGEGSLIAHISQFPQGYKKGHRHGPGANIVILGGAGYSLLWEHDGDQPKRVDWHRNSVFVPPDMWWHQHFNTTSVPARYLAIRWGSRKYLINYHYEGTTTDRRSGGNQIEYDDQAPEIDALFKAECEVAATMAQPRKDVQA